MLLMAKNKQSGKSSKTVASSSVRATSVQEPDAVYFLKLVLYLIIGSQWLRITRGSMQFPLPIGLLVGLCFTRMERFQIDRKIEYAVLLVSMFISFWLPLGLEIVLK